MLPLVLTALLFLPYAVQDAAPSAAAAVTAPSADASEIQPTAHPFLWRIEGDPPSWLYGTMHVGDPRITTLPDAVTEAFGSADALYLEVPMDVGTMSRAAAGAMLPAGQTVKDVLPAPTYERLASFMRRRGMPLLTIERMHPVMISTALPILADTSGRLMAGVPLDMLLWNRAGELGKGRGALETVEEQLALLLGVSPKQQVRMIEQALDQIEEAEREERSLMEGLVLDYLSGDEQALLAWLDQNEQQAASEDPEDAAAARNFTRALVVDRNLLMLEGILKQLDAHEDRSFFFAVGALHQVGPYGLVVLLENEGFTVTRIGAPEPAELVGAP